MHINRHVMIARSAAPYEMASVGPSRVPAR